MDKNKKSGYTTRQKEPLNLIIDYNYDKYIREHSIETGDNLLIRLIRKLLKRGKNV